MIKTPVVMGAALLLALFSLSAPAQDVKGSITANGKSGAFKYARAFEVDSKTEKNYMDVVIVLSDRQLTLAQAQNEEGLETMVRKEGLVALRVKLNPDAKVMSAAPMHPAFTTLLSSALWVRWEPSAFDEKRVAGRLHTEGTRNEFKQQWSYDVTFSAPISLDPAAKTVPSK